MAESDAMTETGPLLYVLVVALLLIPDLDIYRTANIPVKQHGEDAPIQAAMRADAKLEKGGLEGCAVWK